MGESLIIHWLETGDTRGLYQKYCFMEAAARGEITFRVRPYSAWADFGFTAADLPFFKEGFSFFRACQGNRSIRSLFSWRLCSGDHRGEVFPRALSLADGSRPRSGTCKLLHAYRDQKIPRRRTECPLILS